MFIEPAALLILAPVGAKRRVSWRINQNIALLWSAELLGKHETINIPLLLERKQLLVLRFKVESAKWKIAVEKWV